MIGRMHSLVSRGESGQGMTEYIIIVALIAIASIFAIMMFGQNIRALFAGSANALAGSESEDNKGKDGWEAGRRNLKNFGQVNPID